MARLRLLIKMESADAFELKAQALNKDPRLSSAGLSALRFVGDKYFIADGEFSPDLPPETAPEKTPTTPKSAAKTGKSLRVVVQMSNGDAYEMKARALNEDPALKDAGIAALKFVGDGQYISGGEFTPEPVDPGSQPDVASGKKLRIQLRAPRADAYELIARHLNHDPQLRQLGIAGVDLAKGAGLMPVVKESPAPPPKKKPGFVRYVVIALIVGLIGVTGAGALFFSGRPSSPPAPTATEAIAIPVVENATATATPAPSTATATQATSTKTPSPTPTDTPAPSPTVLSCLPPGEALVAVENLSCRYGPGAVYLYRAGLTQTTLVDVQGKADTAYGTWIRVQTRWATPVPCWVNSNPRFVEIPQGDVSCLEPYYPEKAPLINYPTDLFPRPADVEASRSGNLVFISWTGYDLQPGDKPDASNRYLVETWTCQDGKIVFTPQGTDETFAQVRDDGGCDEASHGRVYLAHVDGYIGPSVIPWPP